MGRIRSIHPGLFTDEDFVAMSYQARLCLIGLWVEADDHGCFEWKPIRIKLKIFPGDNVNPDLLLRNLAHHGWVQQYTIDGKDYGALKNFCKWQRPRKPKFYSPTNEDINVFIRLDLISNVPEGFEYDMGTEPRAVKAGTNTKPDKVKDRSDTELTLVKGGGNADKVRKVSAEGRKGYITKDNNTPIAARAKLSPEIVKLTLAVTDLARLGELIRPLNMHQVKIWAEQYAAETILAGIRNTVSAKGYQPTKVKSLKYFEPAIEAEAETVGKKIITQIETRVSGFQDGDWYFYLGEWTKGKPWLDDYVGPAPNQPGTHVPRNLLDFYLEKHGTLDQPTEVVKTPRKGKKPTKKQKASPKP